MIDHLKRLLKGSLIYGVGHAVNSLLQLLLLPLFTNFFDPVDYGLLSALVVFSTFISTIFSFGFGTSIGVNYYNESSNSYKSGLIWSSFFILLISSSMIMIIFGLNINIIDKILFEGKAGFSLIFLAVINAILIILEIPFISRLQFEEKHTSYLVINILFVLMNFLGKLICVWYLKFGIFSIFVVDILSRVLALFLFGISIKKYTPIIWCRKAAIPLFKHGVPMMASFFCLYFIQQGGVFFIQHMQDLTAVGIYTLGYSLGYSIVILTSAVSTAWFPFFMSFIEKKEEASILFGKMTRYYVYFVGLVSTLYYLLADVVVGFISTDNYTESASVVGLISSSFFVLSITNMLLPPIYYAKKVSIVIYLQLIAAISFVGLSYILIPMYSYIGGAIAMFISYGVMLILYYYYNKRLDFKIKYEKETYIFMLCYMVVVIILNVVSYKLSIFNFILKLIVISSFVVLSYFNTDKNEIRYLTIFFKRKRNNLIKK
jgi:O-antigen/teichoic acid export membrane protein